MRKTIRRLHRMLVDRFAETTRLRGRSGQNASWAHYERRARAWRLAQDRHATARARHAAQRSADRPGR